MLIYFYCFTSHVYYFRLEICDKTTIEFSLWFSPLEMYNKTIIGFDFCDMQSYQCLGKIYQPRPSARLITLTSTFDNSAYHKNIIHLMCAPEGNTEFCFPESLNVSRDEVEGNIETRGENKTHYFPREHIIKCFVI